MTNICFDCGNPAINPNNVRFVRTIGVTYPYYNNEIFEIICDICHEYEKDYARMYQPVWVDTQKLYSEKLYDMTHSECVTFINNMSNDLRARLMPRQIMGRGDDIN